jgi:DNA-binding Xre family transcriptional regulator
MKKPTNWDLYFQKQMGDPEMKGFIEEELKTLRIGSRLAQLRERRGMSQTQLAAKVGMSGPNISRIETSPSKNLTLETMLRLFAALDYEVTFDFKRRRQPRLKVARA